MRQADRWVADPQGPLPRHHRRRFRTEHSLGIQRQLDRRTGKIKVRPGEDTQFKGAAEIRGERLHAATLGPGGRTPPSGQNPRPWRVAALIVGGGG